jgi:hypothetical protein
VDYVSSLEGLKKLGEWLLDLHSFAAEKIPVNDKGNLIELLSAKNITEYSTFKKAMKISQ